MPWKYLGYNEPPATKSAKAGLSRGEIDGYIQSLEGIEAEIHRLSAIDLSTENLPKVAYFGRAIRGAAGGLAEYPAVQSSLIGAAQKIEEAAQFIRKKRFSSSSQPLWDAGGKIADARSQLKRIVVRMQY